MARLRELLPDIEAAQAAGVKHQHILDALNAHGFALSMKAYSVMLYRLRQARAKNPEAGLPARAPQFSLQAPVDNKAAPSPSDPKPGAPQRFDWDSLKNDQPEW